MIIENIKTSFVLDEINNNVFIRSEDVIDILDNEEVLVYFQNKEKELELHNVIGVVKGYFIQENVLFLNVEFIETWFTVGSIERLKRGWSTLSAKVYGSLDEQTKVVSDLKILGFVETQK